MKRFSTTMIPLLCSLAMPLCADAYGKHERKAAEKKEADKQWAYEQWDQNHITPYARPCVKGCVGGFLSADFIYWKAQEDGLNYAYTGVGSTANPAATGTVAHPKFKYEPGFKLGAGIKESRDGWDVTLEYTWLRPSRHRSSIDHLDEDDCDCSPVSMKPLNYILLPVLQGDPASGLQTFTMFHASSKWKLNFNVLDAELGRNFWTSKWFTLRPFAGLKFAWLKQRFNVDYESIQAGLRPFNPVASSLSDTADHVGYRMRIKDWAVGIRTGIDMAWYIWRNISVVGDFALNGMWNRFKVKRKDYETVAAGGTAVRVNSFSVKSRSVKPVMEWSLGLRYESGSHRDHVMFTLEALWEEQVWFGQNQFIMMPNQANGDLSMQGLTLKAGLNF